MILMLFSVFKIRRKIMKNKILILSFMLFFIQIFSVYAATVSIESVTATRNDSIDIEFRLTPGTGENVVL